MEGAINAYDYEAFKAVVVFVSAWIGLDFTKIAGIACESFTQCILSFMIYLNTCLIPVAVIPAEYAINSI